MANHPNRNRPTTVTVKPTMTKEPEVHRWQHPIPQAYTSVSTESSLHYIRCALSYQNELLNEIKTLLEQIASSQSE